MARIPQGRTLNQRIARCLLLLIIGGALEFSGTLYLKEIYHVDEVSQHAPQLAHPGPLAWLPAALAFLIGLPCSVAGMLSIPHDNPSGDNRNRKFYSEARKDPRI